MRIAPCLLCHRINVLYVSLERRVSVRWSLLVVTVVAFVYGPKQAYLVFDATKLAIGLMVVFRIGTRYWDGSFSGANAKRTIRQ